MLATAEMSQSKKEAALAILDRGTLHVHLDPRRPGVAVPPHLTKQPNLILAVARSGLHVPIPDLVVDDEGVRGTLSFSGLPFACVAPWPAIYALVDTQSKGVVFREDVPPDLPKPPEHEHACSFCGAKRAEVNHLVAGPGVSICDGCVRKHRRRSLLERLRAWIAPPPPRGALVRMPYRDAADVGCSFCGEDRATIVGARARICRPCVDLSAEILSETKR